METRIDEILSIKHPRHFEGYAGDVLRAFPDCQVERTRDIIHVFYSGEKGASLLFTPEAFEVRLPSLEWVDNHIPTPITRLVDRYVYHDPRILESGFTYSSEFIIDLLYKAVESRKAAYRACKYPRPTESFHR